MKLDAQKFHVGTRVRLTAAIQEVNWYEIAEHWIEDEIAEEAEDAVTTSADGD